MQKLGEAQDSSVGSGGPKWRLGRTEDDVSELYKVANSGYVRTSGW
jgi:hypothetical protein